MSYPKWVSRGHGIGEVLCLNEDEEAAMHAERAQREAPQIEESKGPEAQAEAQVAPERKKPGRPPKVK